MCKIYIVWGQYLSKVLEHICLTFWIQFTEMKWPSLVSILHLQHLLMLENWGTQHLAKSGPNYAAWGWGKQSFPEMKYFSGRSAYLPQLMFFSYSVTGPSPTDVSLSWFGLLYHKTCSLSLPGSSRGRRKRIKRKSKSSFRGLKLQLCHRIKGGICIWVKK